MQASTLRDAAGSLTDTVSDLAHTVAEMTPEVTSRVGDTALRLAALSPWVEEPRRGLALPRWLIYVALLTVVGAVAWKLIGRQAQSPTADYRQPAAPTERRGMAAVNA